MIDRSPEVDHFTVQLDVHLIKVPAPVRKPRIRDTRWRRMSSANMGPKSVPPEAHCLVAKIDAALK